MSCKWIVLKSISLKILPRPLTHQNDLSIKSNTLISYFFITTTLILTSNNQTLSFEGRSFEHHRELSFYVLTYHLPLVLNLSPVLKIWTPMMICDIAVLLLMPHCCQGTAFNSVFMA